MIKVDIFSGFLGAGKTTLIKKLIKEAYGGEKLVLIENEFGQIGIDGGFLKEAGIEITEMNSGCICCSLVGDFGEALRQVAERFSPDRILIEPSGVGKLSDVIRAVRDAGLEALSLNSFTTVIDAAKCGMYLRNFAEFYRNQIEFASTVIFSRTGQISGEKLDRATATVREINPGASLITTPWEELDGAAILAAMEKRNTLETELARLLEEQKERERHHHHHDGECDDPDCDCHHGHHHHHDGECDDPDCDCHHGHHHHDEECDDPDCDCHHGHHHHHDGECDDPDCDCHHGHHHAEEVFMSWGVETTTAYSEAAIKDCLEQLDSGALGTVLRAKGIVPCSEGGWLHFDYVPGEIDVRAGAPDLTGKLCVIGAGLDKAALAALFGL